MPTIQEWDMQRRLNQESSAGTGTHNSGLGCQVPYGGTIGDWAEAGVGVSSPAAGCERRRLVPLALDNLANRISSLGAVLAVLKERLASVLEPDLAQPPKPMGPSGNSIPPPSSPLAPLAEILTTAGLEVEHLERRIARLIDRLEV